MIITLLTFVGALAGVDYYDSPKTEEMSKEIFVCPYTPDHILTTIESLNNESNPFIAKIYS